MEMVGPRLKNSLFWLPQKKMEMPAAVLKKNTRSRCPRSVTARGIKLGNPANITNRSTAARRARASVIQTLINWSCRQHLKAGPRLLSLDFCSVTVSFSLVGFFGHHLCLSFHLSPAPPAVKTPAVPSAELSCSSTMHQLQVASRKLKGKI